MRNGFEGLNVTSFESRRSKEIEKLIAYHGGVPRVAPSMKEIPIDTLNISGFINDLKSEKIDLLILFTGVGTRMLTEHIGKDPDRYDLPVGTPSTHSCPGVAGGRPARSVDRQSWPCRSTAAAASVRPRP